MFLSAAEEKLISTGGASQNSDPARSRTKAPEGGRIPDRRNPGDRDHQDRKRCSHCGFRKHTDLDCWKRLICEKCGNREDVKLGRSPWWNPVRVERSRYCIYAYGNKIYAIIHVICIRTPPRLRGELPSDLKRGESRGYWKRHSPGKWFRQAKISGRINQERVILLLDTGAEVSILDTTFARKVGCNFDTSQRQECAGIGANVYTTEGRTLVYFFDIWIRDLSGQNAILGMDFMVPDGPTDQCDYLTKLKYRLIVVWREGEISDPRTKSANPGWSVGRTAARIKLSATEKLLVTRGERWVPTVTEGPGRIRYLVISNIGEEILRLDHRLDVGMILVGMILDQDNVPRSSGFVSVGSRRYREWQNLALESTVDTRSETPELVEDPAEPAIRHSPGVPGPCLSRYCERSSRTWGRPRLEAPISRHLVLTGTDTEIPALPNSTTILNLGDADNLPAPLSLTTIPGLSRADDSGTRVEEDLPAPNAVGSHELAIVGSLQPVALPTPSGDASTRPSGTPDTLAVGSTTARAVEQSTAPSASFGNADTNQHGAIGSCHTFWSRRDRPDDLEGPKPEHNADIFVETLPGRRRFFGNAPGLHSRNHIGRPVLTFRAPGAPVRGRPSASLDEPRTRNRATPGPILPGPASLVDEDLAPRKGDCPAHPGNPAPAGSQGRPWTANFRSECLCLPVVTDPVALQVDLEELRFSGGARDFTSVIATLQTLLHDAGYAFLNLVPTWGRTLRPELLAAQDGQFMSDTSFLVRRDDAPFQTLDPEVTSAFRVEEDGGTLMFTLEEHELLGMVTRLRLAHSTGTEATLWEHSRTAIRAFVAGVRRSHRVWGGPIPEVVGTSSLASGDAPMLTPDENEEGSHGLESSTAMVGVFMATTGMGTGQPYTAEQPTLYVPVAEYPPGQDGRPPPHALPRTAPPVWGDGPDGSEEETKTDAPMIARGAHLPENSRDWDRDLQEVGHASASRPGDPPSLGSGGPGTFGFPAAGGYAPGYGVSFRPFIAYDAVEPFDTSLSLDKRRTWWDKFQYTASSGGWREQELCTRLYSRLSHNPGTKAWVQQLPESVCRSWKQLSDRFYKEFCRSTESQVERYLRLKQESRETPRTFLWRLNAAATKANVNFHSGSGCRRHVNQFLKNIRDRELQLRLQGRLGDVLKQVEEMERGMCRKPANDVQFGSHKPQGVPETQAPDTEGLRWEDEDDSGYGYPYDEENDEAYAGLVDQEEVFRAEAPRLWNERNGRSQNRHDPRGVGPPGAPRPSVPCPVCNKL
ncbi:hypothetical protein PHMEG_00015656 [Phytophthora megakarya]|uniref:Peptidase A2 domain-containing protein n=1 Tax=Phytophthora megakarya TaxID=4795 RepID=A0A225W163_9STRA|nr:hypothetical protein PHMEG_00015656 [Phytophthora megakarya]